MLHFGVWFRGATAGLNREFLKENTRKVVVEAAGVEDAHGMRKP